MNMTTDLRILAALRVPVLLLACALTLHAQAPSVRKVEPPDWWVGLPSPTLLIYGENLAGAKVTMERPGVRVARSELASSGRHLFVTLEIDAQVQPGPVHLTVTTRQGRTTAPFPIHARSPEQRGFQGLSRDDVIYLIMPDRFADGDAGNNPPPGYPRESYDRSQARAYHGGDLRGIRDRLPYLADLGVTALWLNPIYNNHPESPHDYHGYSAIDFYAVEEHFGSMADLQEMVAVAHRHGIKVFLDKVINHSGPRHEWVQNPPEPDWLNGTPQTRLIARAPFDHLVDPNAVLRQWRDLVEGWFAGILPDLNQNNPRVAQYFLQNAIWWAEKARLDGYRLDTFPYVPRTYWSEWHRRLFEVYPEFVTIGETFHPDPAVVAFFSGGEARWDGVDSRVTTQFDFPFYYELRQVILHGAPVQRLQHVLQRDWLYRNPEMLVTFLGNHDVMRFMTVPGSSKEKLKLAYSLLLSTRGIPQIYYGDEIGMEGADDPDNRRDFPGGFPGDPRNAFTTEGRTADEQEIFSHVRSLLHLRKQHAALRHGEQRHLYVDDGDCSQQSQRPESPQETERRRRAPCTLYVFLRAVEGERLVVAFNNSDQPRQAQIELLDTPIADARTLRPILGPSGEHTVTQGRAEFTVPARTAVIYEVR